MKVISFLRSQTLLLIVALLFSISVSLYCGDDDDDDDNDEDIPEFYCDDDDESTVDCDWGEDAWRHLTNGYWGCGRIIFEDEEDFEAGDLFCENEFLAKCDECIQQCFKLNEDCYYLVPCVEDCGYYMF